MTGKATVPPEELDDRAEELFEKSQERDVVKIIQYIDRKTGNVLKTKVIQPTVYSSPEAAKNALKGLRNKTKKNLMDDIVQDISAIQDFENSTKYTEDEKQFLSQRKAEYEQFYIFETPFERNLLRYLLIEEMNLYRLYEKMATTKGKDSEEVDERISKAVKRLSTLAADLKIKRESKKDNKDESGFAKLEKEYDEKQGQTISQETQQRWEQEEQALQSRKRTVVDEITEAITEESEEDEEGEPQTS